MVGTYKELDAYTLRDMLYSDSKDDRIIALNMLDKLNNDIIILTQATNIDVKLHSLFNKEVRAKLCNNKLELKKLLKLRDVIFSRMYAIKHYVKYNIGLVEVLFGVPIIVGLILVSPLLIPIYLIVIFLIKFDKDLSEYANKQYRSSFINNAAGFGFIALFPIASVGIGAAWLATRN